MKIAAIILGLILAVVAVVYFVVPAGALPGFFPGFKAGSDHIHTKHGLASAVGAAVLLGIGWWAGRR
jgi:hypothetical protein